MAPAATRHTLRPRKSTMPLLSFVCLDLTKLYSKLISELSPTKRLHSTSCPPPCESREPGSRAGAEICRAALRGSTRTWGHRGPAFRSVSSVTSTSFSFCFCRAPRAPTFRDLFAPFRDDSDRSGTVTGVFSSYNQLLLHSGLSPAPESAPPEPPPGGQPIRVRSEYVLAHQPHASADPDAAKWQARKVSHAAFHTHGSQDQ